MPRSRRLLSGALLAVLAACGPLKTENKVTGEKQFVGGMTPQQEIQLGQQAAPQMTKQFGGEDASAAARDYVTRIGQKVVRSSGAGASGYPFQFHLLGDAKTINAFALPGGQVFITRALLDRLQDEAGLAGVLGHEVGHVVARHTAEHIAESQLLDLAAVAAGAVATDPQDPERGKRVAAMAGFAGQIVNLRFSRKDELEADALGVRFMSESGYDPRALVRVMEMLKATEGGGGAPEFLSTHPDPGNREDRIREEIAKRFPGGAVPAGYGLGPKLSKGLPQG